MSPERRSQSLDRRSGPTPAGERDPFIDFCRAVSLVVVVLWHWTFTILVWTPNGPDANNPIGAAPGSWVATWLFQVMPLFFFVGGYSHEVVWRRTREQGGGYGRFVVGRAKRLVVPSLLLICIWVSLGLIAVSLGAPDGWTAKGVLLVISPLWFIAIYLLLVMLAPVALWLHRRFGPIVVVWLIGLAAIVDMARFRSDLSALGWLNMIFVWGACHQLGFFYDRLAVGDRRWAWSMLWGGLAGLFVLVNTTIYPGSMVGVPGHDSNMSPPTLCIVALVFFQAGGALLLRPWLLRRLERPRWSAATATISRFSMPLFIFHTTGMAIALLLAKTFGFLPPSEADPRWWLERPLWIALPLLCTAPVILLFGKRWTRPPSTSTRTALPGDARLSRR